MKRTQVYLPEELHEAVRRLAFEQRRSMADVVREAVTAYMDQQDDAANGTTVVGETARRLDG